MPELELSDCLIDAPPRPKRWIVLAHGAGAPMDHAWMSALSARLSTELGVLRFEFPYMARRRREGVRAGPDGAARLEERWREAAALGASLAGGLERVFLAGKSMGGRYATRVADEISPAGVIAYGYPFHPPGKPDKLRTAHLEALETPTLILQGARDPFGSEEEVREYEARGLLASAIELRFLDDGEHSFKPRKSSGKTLDDQLDEAAAASLAFARAASRL